jgi:nucleotide-binding universal stress UspA family protein
MKVQGKPFSKISKILVATDGSTPSMRAADYAISIAIKNESQLITICVIDFYKYPYLPSSIILAPTFGSEKYMQERNKAEECIERIKGKYKENSNSKINTEDLKAKIVGGTKSAAATIIEYAESQNVDLVVIGSRGRTKFKKLLLGSVSSDVVKYAHCPVLVVR